MMHNDKLKKMNIFILITMDVIVYSSAGITRLTPQQALNAELRLNKEDTARKYTELGDILYEIGTRRYHSENITVSSDFYFKILDLLN